MRATRADDPAEIAERHRTLDDIWAGLSEVERRYVADNFAGFSFEEIAQRNGRKVGTVSSNLFRARKHARSLGEPSFPAVIGAAAWQRVTDLARRVRNAAHSTSTAAAAQPVQSLTISLTLAGLVAGVGPAVAAVPAAVALQGGGVSASSPFDGAGAAPNLAAQSAPVGAGGSRVSFASGGGGSAPPASAAAGLPAVLVSAASETPEDTQIYTATPSPSYPQDHTILALGRGQSCACNVLLRSTDGGATWTSTAGVASGDQLVLPPDYPRDPRLFVGYAHQAPDLNNWWAPSFGDSFRALPGPAGSIALPAGFDSGDPRVIVSALSGIWSVDMATQVAHPLVVETSRNSVPAVATPVGAGGTGVLAMTSSQAVAPGTIASLVAPSQARTLWACPPGTPCRAQSTVPVDSDARLTVSPAYAIDNTLLAYTWTTGAVLSRDGGSSFTPVQLPPDAGRVNFATFGDPAGDATPMWMVVQHSNGFALEFSPNLNGAWHEVDHGLRQITGGTGYVVALAPHRVLYLSTTTGMLCTVDDGGTWSPRCPAA